MITILPSKTYKSSGSMPAEMPPLPTQLQRIVPQDDTPSYLLLSHQNDDLIDQNQRLFSLAVYGASVGFILGLACGIVGCLMGLISKQ